MTIDLIFVRLKFSRLYYGSPIGFIGNGHLLVAFLPVGHPMPHALNIMLSFLFAKCLHKARVDWPRTASFLTTHVSSFPTEIAPSNQQSVERASIMCPMFNRRLVLPIPNCFCTERNAVYIGLILYKNISLRPKELLEPQNFRNT